MDNKISLAWLTFRPHNAYHVAHYFGISETLTQANEIGIMDKVAS